MKYDFAYYAYINGTFTSCSGCAEIPAVLTFVDTGTQSSPNIKLNSFMEAEDGSSYVSSIKKLFPATLWEVMIQLNETEHTTRSEQMRKDAQDYLDWQARIKELGLTEQDFPNDYYIDTGNSDTVIYPVQKDVSYIILRDHIYEEQLTDAETFQTHAAEYSDSIPYNFVLVDDQIAVVRELYVP